MTPAGHLDGLADGDAELFARLYPGLRRFARMLDADHADPDDLIQEALLRTLRSRALHTLDDPQAYLRRTLVRLASNHRRARFRRRRAETRAGHDDVARRDVYPSDLSPLQSLRPADRAALYLVIVEHHTHAEVAALLGWTETQSRQRVHRALASLRKDTEHV